MTIPWLQQLAHLTAADKHRARQVAEESGEPESWLISQGLAEEIDILRAKSLCYRVPYIRLLGYHPAPEALGLLIEEQARKLKALPLFCVQEQIYVAMPDPDDLRCEDFLRKLTGRRVKPVLATPEDIAQAITRSYLASQLGQAFLPTSALRSRDEPSSEAQALEPQSPIVKATWKVIAEAIRLGASDIHFEPDAEQLFLRYRIDGVLHDFPPPDYDQYPGVVSRIKVLSNMDIAERRLPQDGRLSVELDGKVFDLRVSLLPNVHGEGICIRILDPASVGRDLKDMGFDAITLERYSQVIARPHGIVLVTGPTGSGKSTTLYATLSRIKSRERKIITVEDPVEYKIAGLVQVAIRPDIGFTFEAGLRSILRHDPDVVMLGEIRDLPSAVMAFRAALTGHLLFSTLHTNSAALAFTRLIDMGIPAFQVMAALTGVLAQRLIRKLCPECKSPTALTSIDLTLLGLPDSYLDAQVYQPVGCPSCQNIGYRGRTAIHEFLEVTPEIRCLSTTDLTDVTIERTAIEQGFQTLRRAAVAKLLDGVTSISEVLTVTA